MENDSWNMKLESVKSYKTQACKCLGGHSPFHLHCLGRTSHWTCTWLGSCLGTNLQMDFSLKEIVIINRTRSIKKCIFFKAKKQAIDVCYRYSNNNVMGISNITNTTWGILNELPVLKCMIKFSYHYIHGFVCSAYSYV